VHLFLQQSNIHFNNEWSLEMETPKLRIVKHAGGFLSNIISYKKGRADGKVSIGTPIKTLKISWGFML